MDNLNHGKALVINSETLLGHWQVHRNLTRRVIEAFPDDKLFEYSVGGMRPFSELALEMIGMAASGMPGVVTGRWEKLEEVFHHSDKLKPKTKQELLSLWDEVTEQIDTFWRQIPAERFHEIDTAYGLYEGAISWIILYWIDNEIHHRGQGYVYLRSLGIEPPPFWDRDQPVFRQNNFYVPG